MTLSNPSGGNTYQLQIVFPQLDQILGSSQVHTQILSALTSLISKVTTMAGEIDALKTAVTAEKTVIQSAIVLINGITDRVSAAVAAALAANPGVDLTPLNDLTTEINAETTALASAVAAQTPAAAPAPTPIP